MTFLGYLNIIATEDCLALNPAKKRAKIYAENYDKNLSQISTISIDLAGEHRRLFDAKKSYY